MDWSNLDVFTNIFLFQVSYFAQHCENRIRYSYYFTHKSYTNTKIDQKCMQLFEIDA